LLREARIAMEGLKAAELRDYFRDECVTELEAARMPLEGVSAKAAVIYPILLDDRLEILIGRYSGVSRHTVPVGAEELTREVRALRNALGSPAAAGFRAPAERLYAWLVEPYADALAAQGVDTLVFVPDGALSTIPMAALHDGTRYVGERFAVAVTPGLSLVAPHALDIRGGRMLLAGLSESAGGFPALPQVKNELAAIHALYSGDVVMDAAFRVDSVEEAMRERPRVVHLATHAVFTGDAESSFLLTHDGRLTMQRLGEVVGLTRFGDEPLELLTLSACETAAGDDRAALGLSGVAVRAGARSALGTLWAVPDASTYELIVAFYRQLEDPGVSKAEALRRAQTQLRASPHFAHPYYWAPFLLINNWL
jgi:CHAT domain-containing protein